MYSSRTSYLVPFKDVQITASTCLLGAEVVECFGRGDTAGVGEASGLQVNRYLDVK